MLDNIFEISVDQAAGCMWNDISKPLAYRNIYIDRMHSTYNRALNSISKLLVHHSSSAHCKFLLEKTCVVTVHQSFRYRIRSQNYFSFSGIQTPVFICTQDGVKEVDDEKCLASNKPNMTSRQCNPHNCPSR